MTVKAAMESSPKPAVKAATVESTSKTAVTAAAMPSTGYSCRRHSKDRQQNQKFCLHALNIDPWDCHGNSQSRNSFKINALIAALAAVSKTTSTTALGRLDRLKITFAPRGIVWVTSWRQITSAYVPSLPPSQLSWPCSLASIC
jgi:hypothetical protein